MGNISFIERDRVGELAAFLARNNQFKGNHIGYCGTEQREIEQTLLEEISDRPLEQSFLVARQEMEIIAAIGFDIDEESQSAEVWGPFSSPDAPQQILQEMWTTLTAIHKLDKYMFFINKVNQRAIQFVKSLNAQHMGNHFILVMKSVNYQQKTCRNISEYSQEQFEFFQELHQLAFPNTYYEARTIIKRLNETRKLFIYQIEGILAGYAYVEADLLEGNASIEYIAVDPFYRRRGIGKQLLYHALNFVFSNCKVTEVRLTVNSSENAAIGLYNSVGFEKEDEMLLYVINKN